jgi:hypothetical protein
MKMSEKQNIQELEIDVRSSGDILFINGDIYTNKEAYEIAVKLIGASSEILSYIDNRSIKEN